MEHSKEVPVIYRLSDALYDEFVSALEQEDRPTPKLDAHMARKAQWD